MKTKDVKYIADSPILVVPNVGSVGSLLFSGQGSPQASLSRGLEEWG